MTYPHEFGPQHGGPATNTANPSVEQFLGTPYDPSEDEEHQPLSIGPGMLWKTPRDPMDRIASALETLVETFTGDKQPVETFTAELATTELDESLAFAEEKLDDLEDKLQTLTQVISDVEAALGKSKAAPALAAKAVIEAYRNPQVPEEPETVEKPGNEEALELTKDRVEGGRDEVPEKPVAAVQGHTRTPHENGTDFCRECTAETQEWILWPCAAAVAANPEAKAPTGEHQQPVHDAPVEEWRAYARSLGYAGPDIDKANRSVIRTTLGIAQPVSS